MKLYELRNAHEMTQTQLAEALGVTTNTIANYEKGSLEPNMSVLVALADFFDVSIDYLIGRSDDPEWP